MKIKVEKTNNTDRARKKHCFLRALSVLFVCYTNLLVGDLFGSDGYMGRKTKCA